MDAYKRNLIVAEECAPPDYLPYAIRQPLKRKFERDRLDSVTPWDLLSPAAKRSKAGMNYLIRSQSNDVLSTKLKKDEVVKIPQFKQPFAFQALDFSNGRRSNHNFSREPFYRRRLLTVYEPNYARNDADLMAHRIMTPQLDFRRSGYGAVISGNTVAKQELQREADRREREFLEYVPFPRENNVSQEGFGLVSRSQEDGAVVDTKANVISKEMDATEKDSSALVPKTLFDDNLVQQEHKEALKSEPLYKKLYNRIVNPWRVRAENLRKHEAEFYEQKKEAVQLNIQAIQEKQIARKEEKEALQQKVVDSALKPLSSEAEEQVDEALLHGDGRDVLVNHEGTNIIITRNMMQCLLPGEWLNDEVINVYLALLKERELREPKKHPKCHIFNTFFYNKCLEGRVQLFSNSERYDYKGVRRWTTHKKLGYNLKDCAKIIVPVHQAIHWTVAVINIRDKRLEFYDSLRGSDKGCLENLARYITDDIKDKSGEDWDVSSWPRSCPKDIPLQLNGCDCGVFMVKYADYESRDAPFSFDQSHMEYFRRRMVWELLQQGTKD